MLMKWRVAVLELVTLNI